MDKKENAPENVSEPDKQIKLLLMIVLAVAFSLPILSMVFTVNLLGNKISELKPTPTPNPEKSAEENEKKAPSSVVFYEPLEFLVNLADTTENHYLRTTISLAFRADSLENGKGGGGHGEKKNESPAVIQLKPKEPIIRDSIIAVISSRQFRDLSTSAGKSSLKDSIRQRLESELGLAGVSIYFTSFTLQ